MLPLYTYDEWSLLRQWIVRVRDAHVPSTNYDALARNNLHLVFFERTPYLSARDADAALACLNKYGHFSHVASCGDCERLQRERLYREAALVLPVDVAGALPPARAAELLQRLEHQFAMVVLCVPGPRAWSGSSSSSSSASPETCALSAAEAPEAASAAWRRLYELLRTRYAVEETASRELVGRLDYRAFCGRRWSASGVFSPLAPQAASALSAPSAHVRDGRQLQYLWARARTDARLREALVRTLCLPLKRGPRAERERLLRLTETWCTGAFALPDEVVYNGLRVELKRAELLLPSAHTGDPARASRKADNVARALAQCAHPTATRLLEGAHAMRVLDFGCGEAGITAALARRFAHWRVAGCDVRALPPCGHGSASGAQVQADERKDAAGAFAFDLLDESCCVEDLRRLYADARFDLALAQMALHHVRPASVAEEVARELARVVAPGGLLFLREHDLDAPSEPERAALLDVLHGLYARAWRDPPEAPSFCDRHEAHYRPAAHWARVLAEAGFRALDAGSARPEDPYRVYEQLFERVRDEDQDSAAAAGAAAPCPI